MEPIPVFDLGLAPYRELQVLQGRLRRAVAAGKLPGLLLLLEHEPVVTLGRRGTAEDLLAPLPPGVDLVTSERGGAATLHAPGQLVSYPVVRLPRRDLRAFVHGLEEVLLRLLRRYGIQAGRREGHPGLYVGGDKIASIGLRCERWVASHGTSLNVDLDLSLFDLIVSCAERGLRQTSMTELLKKEGERGRAALPLSMEDLKQQYREIFAEVLAFPVLPLEKTSWKALEEWLDGAEFSLPEPAPDRVRRPDG